MCVIKYKTNKGVVVVAAWDFVDKTISPSNISLKHELSYTNWMKMNSSHNAKIIYILKTYIALIVVNLNLCHDSGSQYYFSK